MLTAQLRAMRKLLCSLFLPLVLLLSQQGALVHELSHFRLDVHDVGRAGDRRDARADTSAPAQAKDALCALCLAFNHLAAPIVTAVPALVLLDLRHTHLTQTALRQLAPTPPTARSRGPPSVL